MRLKQKDFSIGSLTVKEKKVRSEGKKVRDICQPVSSSISKSFYAIFWPLWFPISTALLRTFSIPANSFLIKATKTNTVSENQNQSNFSDQSERGWIIICQWELKVKQANCLKRGTMRMTKSRLFLYLHLIGWEDGTSFRDQSESEGK